VTEKRAVVLEALAADLDVDAVLEKFPGLGREGLRSILGEAARVARPGRKRRKVIAFVDGASRGNPGEAGAGVIFKDAEGNVVERHARYLGKATNNMAEYKALILALRRAGELGVTSLQVYSDSELLVNQINGRYRVRVPHLQELCQEAIRLMRAVGRVNVSHVPREENAEADEQANIAIDQSAKS
jgi:ribonuclease HI